MYQTVIKRLLDIVLAGVLLVLASPLFLMTAVAIRIVNDGSVVFKQKRYGKDKKPFIIYKFRTMYASAPSENPTNSFVGVQSHISKPGKIIRKLSLDELPQLINVLRGDMSMVGPRPVILKEMDLITERDKYGANACKPGITGWAQVCGRDELQMKKKAKLDGEYVANQGFLMDLRCVLLTFWAVVSVKGHQEGSAATQESFSLQENGDGNG
jgi:O-antigen biosynthesis protein WbqP